MTARNITFSITANAVVGEQPAIYEKARAYINARYEPDPVTGCWRWTGPVTRDGYGQIGSKPIAFQIAKGAHRVAKIVFHGWQPSGRGEQIRHQCHQRNCVNPSHMLTGSAADNILDMCDREKSRVQLNPDKVRQIRSLLHSGWLQRDVAAMFNVSISAISHIHRQRCWKFVK